MFSQYFLSSRPENLLVQPGILATVSFTGLCGPGELGDIPTGLKSLVGKPFEVLTYGDKIAERGETGGCQWNVIDDLACVATWIKASECNNIEKSTFEAYSRLFSWLNDSGFQHPLRMWNFIPHINNGEGDEEEYKKFCSGRHRAFTEHGLGEQDYPAASALGHHVSGGVIYTLACRRPSEQIENPMQEPAYRYPRIYGPKSPSFARASIFNDQQFSHLMISGTASIRGHETLGVDDTGHQLQITEENILSLQQSVAPEASDFSPVRAYLRDAKDLEVTEKWLKSNFPTAETNILHADICRSNLSVEVETVAKRRI